MKKMAQNEYKILRRHQVYGTPINELKQRAQTISKISHEDINERRRRMRKENHEDFKAKRREFYQKNKEKMKAKETPAAKEKRLAYARERMRTLYKSEKTPEQKEKHLNVRRRQQLKKLESETEEQRAKRREYARNYQKNKIANETVEQYRKRRKKNRESFLNRFERESTKTVNYEIEPADIQITPSTSVDEVEPFDSVDVKPLIPFDIQPPSPVEIKRSSLVKIKPTTSIKIKPATSIKIKPSTSAKKKPPTSSDVPTSSRPKRYKKPERTYHFSSEMVLIRERNGTDDQFIKEEPEDYEDTELSQDFGGQKESRTSTEVPSLEYDLDVSIDAPKNNKRPLETRKTKGRKESSEEDSDSDLVDPFKSSHFKQSAAKSDEKSDE